VQPQVQIDDNPSARVQRLRARQARRRFLGGLQVAGAVVFAMLSASVAIGVFTLHLGIRPVLTGSMRPDYGPGAVLFTRQVPTSAIRPGMIVLFVPPGEHAEFAHRITSVTTAPGGPVITTKGDANKAADPWHARLTAPEVNEVVGSVPGFGRLLVGIRGFGQILLALLGGAIAVWAGGRLLFGPSSRPSSRRVTTSGA
jgi:signal peptidase I